MMFDHWTALHELLHRSFRLATMYLGCRGAWGVVPHATTRLLLHVFPKLMLQIIIAPIAPIKCRQITQLMAEAKSCRLESYSVGEKQQTITLSAVKEEEPAAYCMDLILLTTIRRRNSNSRMSWI